MKKQLRFLIILCLGLVLSGAALDTYAWGGDITLPVTAGYKYSNARISVAFDGTIYYGRTFSLTPTGPTTNWEVLRSKDNGVTFTQVSSGGIGGSGIVTAFDIICAGTNGADFGLFIARSYLDTVSADATLYCDKNDTIGLYLGGIVSETFNFTTVRGWTSLSLATDCRDKNSVSAPYEISLVAGKANTNDSIIIWTGADGGTTMHRAGIYGTSGYIRNVSASIGSTLPGTSTYGRLAIAWDDYSGPSMVWGAVKVMFMFPDDGTAPFYTGPYLIDSGNEHYRRPCVVASQNSAGGSGPGTSDMRIMVAMEYDASNIVWAAVFDSIVLKSPTYLWSNISSGSGTGASSQCHGVFDPVYDNFLFTYYNDDANTLPYVIKSMGSPATEDAFFFQPNYRDLSTLNAVPMFPRVDMSVSRGMAAFAWNDSPNSMFDAEWSTVAGISTNTGLSELNIYPNPAADIANISFDANEAQSMVITVMDLTGRVFINEEVHVNQGNNLLPVSVNKLASGNYIIQLKGASISSSLKLLVTK
ncbi:MAG: T9SS type A sorting domain-containing protein [Bacteroidota bacterium]